MKEKCANILGIFCFFLVIIGTGILLWGLLTHNPFISEIFCVSYVGVMLIGMCVLMIGIILSAIFIGYKSIKKVILSSVNCIKKILKSDSPYLPFAEKNNLMKIVIICNIILLLLCIAPMPYDYYIIVRFFSMAVFSIMAYNYYVHNKKDFSCVFIFLALLFQPFVKIQFEKATWNIIDIAVAGFLLFLILRKKTGKNLDV